MTSFPTGKVPTSFLSKLWARHAPTDPSVVAGPGIGRDVAVLDLGDEYLVAKSDPITFATDRIGWYAVHVNANDVACSGAEPEWFLATLLLPQDQADEALVEEIFEQVTEACSTVGAVLVGGHTEVTHGIDRPILIGSLLGRVSKTALVTSDGAQPGDAVLLTGGVPVEATAIIAREKSAELEGRFSEEFLQRCRNFLFDPGISVLDAARTAARTAEVHAMHDPTEGGLLTGLWELAQAAEVDLQIEAESIPLLPEGQQLCEVYNLDPLASIASGALLITVAEDDVTGLLEAFATAGVNCAHIGSVLEGPGDVYMHSGSERQKISVPERDEIARLFE
ncbi:MAG: AIR synthase family protein [Anaerolineales bacterium]|nr:AIR synthase family protein [Anaerolineales bacterium]